MIEGIDLEMLEHNLSLTPTERVRQHDAALQLVMALREAGERLHDQPFATA